jgi:DNA replication licensing factor MCM3
LRTIEGRKALPLTPRAFETLIRLATAHAKIRVAEKVSVKDAKAAIGLLRFAIFGEPEAPGKKKKKKRGASQIPAESSEDEDESIPKKRSRRKKEAGPKQGEPEVEAEAEVEAVDEQPDGEVSQEHVQMIR